MHYSYHDVRNFVLDYLFGNFSRDLVVAIIAWGIINFVVACVQGFRGRLPSALRDKPTGDEPAYKQYFLRRGFLDVWDILREHWRRNQRPLSWIWAPVIWLESLGKRFPGFEGFLGLAGLALIPILLMVTVYFMAPSLVTNLAFAVLFSAVMLICIVVNSVLTLLVRSMEYTFVAYHRFVNHCPHCYEKFGLPVYRCVCGRWHKRLLPGTYGIFLRRCACKRKLPTSYLWGRHRIESFCPSCHRRLDGEDPTKRPVLLPVIAGRSAGKTTYQVALLTHLLQRQKQGQVRVEFVVPAEKARYEAAVAMLRSGSLLPQTLEMLPKALQLDFSIAVNGESTLGSLRDTTLRLHLFDAAGEAYQDEQWMQQLRFLPHCHGLVMLLDPLSTAAVRQQEDAMHPTPASYSSPTETDPQFSFSVGMYVPALSPANPAEADPDELYDRLLEFLEQHKLRRQLQKVEIPLAIVLTKTDACGIAAEISDRRAQAGSASAAVRAWLVDNQLGGMVDKIEAQFATYRYFACSALAGPAAAGGQRPGDLADVEEPFFWLLRASKICGPAAATRQNA